MTPPSSSRPATYFLQEAVDRGLDAIAARLDRNQQFLPYFWLQLSPVPGLEHKIWDTGDVTGRYVDAFLLGRQVTGNANHADAEAALHRLLLTCDPFANPFMAGRMLLAYVDLYLQNPGGEHRQQADDLIRLIASRLTFEKDIAYYFKQTAGWRSKTQPLGDFAAYPTYPLGGVMLAMSRYLQAVQSPESEELLDRMVRFVLRESGVFEEDGSFYGHTHSGGILTAAAGILRWAIRHGDTVAINRMRGAMDHTLRHSSRWGWVPDGLSEKPTSCETCAITDALHLAIVLGRHVEPSYFEFVERCARNQLLENQFTNPERLLPREHFPNREAVVRALRGSWASWSLPSSLDNCTQGVEGCCLGSGVRGCFLVWESAIEKTEGVVSVHLALSRNSPWVEVVGFQPYEGRLDVLVHDAPKVRVRIPSWVDVAALRVSIDGKPSTATVSRQKYLKLNGLKQGQRVKVEYPLRQEETEEVVGGVEYRVRWRGDTVVGILPRGEKYPLYERSWMERDDTPEVGRRPHADQKGGPIHW